MLLNTQKQQLELYAHPFTTGKQIYLMNVKSDWMHWWRAFFFHHEWRRHELPTLRLLSDPFIGKCVFRLIVLKRTRWLRRNFQTFAINISHSHFVCRVHTISILIGKTNDALWSSFFSIKFLFASQIFSLSFFFHFVVVSVALQFE